MIGTGQTQKAEGILLQVHFDGVCGEVSNRLLNGGLVCESAFITLNTFVDEFICNALLEWGGSGD